MGQYKDVDEIWYQVNCWLFDREAWCRSLETEPLHVCYDEFIRPLKIFIEELFEKAGDHRYGDVRE